MDRVQSTSAFKCTECTKKNCSRPHLQCSEPSNTADATDATTGEALGDAEMTSGVHGNVVDAAEGL